MGEQKRRPRNPLGHSFCCSPEAKGDGYLVYRLGRYIGRQVKLPR